ncbi:MAG: ABC transporter substrate-binding protein [Alphaproteobacteria bacterium]|nr:ABC transporter substrate-binding protein [Alphaproteobacteria bacterium]
MTPHPAQSLNSGEQGKVWLPGHFPSSRLVARQAGAPFDLAAPKEGISAMPSGICLVANAPNKDLATAYINEMLGAQLQAELTPLTYSLPTNTDAPSTVALPAGVEVFAPDWGWFTKNRTMLVERWDREMAI